MPSVFSDTPQSGLCNTYWLTKQPFFFNRAYRMTMRCALNQGWHSSGHRPGQIRECDPAVTILHNPYHHDAPGVSFLHNALRKHLGLKTRNFFAMQCNMLKYMNEPETSKMFLKKLRDDPSVTPLQKVAKEPGCHSREGGPCRATARNPFFSNS